MIKYFFYSYHYFYVLNAVYRIFPNFFGLNLKLVYDSLHSNISYRLPDNAKRDFFISFRELKRLVFANLKYKELFLTKGKQAIYDTGEISFTLRKNYIQKFANDNEFISLSKDNVIKALPAIHKWMLFAFSIFNSIPVFLVNLLKRNKLKNGLKVRQYAECWALLYICKKHNIEKIYYFNIYEPDSNITSYLLNKLNIKTVLITSEVPLHFGNTRMIGTEIDFCFGYQLEEYEKYKNTIVAEKVNLLVPETVFETASYYIKNNNFSTPKNTIGFISSGMWLRKMLGDADSGLNELENENLIISYLKEFVSSNSSVKLIIYLHPIEKNKANFELTKEHYKEIFENKEPEFAPLNTPSALSFNNSDVCIALYSTLLYERIFMGFKSIIMPLGINDFPITDSSLHKVSAKTKDKLFDRLNIFLNQTNDEYIKYMGFENRFYKNFESVL
jgi:hypothetical protein